MRPPPAAAVAAVAVEVAPSTAQWERQLPLPARRVVSSPTQLIDIFPTILELAEVDEFRAKVEKFEELLKQRSGCVRAPASQFHIE